MYRAETALASISAAKKRRCGESSDGLRVARPTCGLFPLVHNPIATSTVTQELRAGAVRGRSRLQPSAHGQLNAHGARVARDQIPYTGDAHGDALRVAGVNQRGEKPRVVALQLYRR